MGLYLLLLFRGTCFEHYLLFHEMANVLYHFLMFSNALPRRSNGQYRPGPKRAFRLLRAMTEAGHDVDRAEHEAEGFASVISLHMILLSLIFLELTGFVEIWLGIDDAFPRFSFSRPRPPRKSAIAATSLYYEPHYTERLHRLAGLGRATHARERPRSDGLMHALR